MAFFADGTLRSDPLYNAEFASQVFHFNKLIIFAWLLWNSDQQKCPAPQYLHDVLDGNCKYQVLSDVLITAEKININAMRDKSYIS